MRNRSTSTIVAALSVLAGVLAVVCASSGVDRASLQGTGTGDPDGPPAQLEAVLRFAPTPAATPGSPRRDFRLRAGDEGPARHHPPFPGLVGLAYGALSPPSATARAVASGADRPRAARFFPSNRTSRGPPVPARAS